MSTRAERKVFVIGEFNKASYGEVGPDYSYYIFSRSEGEFTRYLEIDSESCSYTKYNDINKRFVEVEMDRSLLIAILELQNELLKNVR